MRKDVRLEPLITEKSSLAKMENKYVFKIDSSINKIELKQFMQSTFKVKVLGVNIVNVPSKVRRMGKSIGKKRGYKKAYVTIEPGKKIQALEAV